MAWAGANRSRNWSPWAPNRNAIMETEITPAEEKRYAELQLMALEAARAGDALVLRFMVEAGLPVNLRDLKGNTLLMLACYHGHVEAVACLLEGGAEPDRRNLRGQTPLGGVAFKGYVEIAELLLNAGADLNADQGGGTTPLMLASLFGRVDMVELLTRRGANARARNWWGVSADLFAFAFRVGSRLRHVFPTMLHRRPAEDG